MYGSVEKALPGVEISAKTDDEILVKIPRCDERLPQKQRKKQLKFSEDGYFRTGDAGRIDEEENSLYYR